MVRIAMLARMMAAPSMVRAVTLSPAIAQPSTTAIKGLTYECVETTAGERTWSSQLYAVKATSEPNTIRKRNESVERVVNAAALSRDASPEASPMASSIPPPHIICMAAKVAGGVEVRTPRA
jgi:hypothetical protein